MNDLVVKNVPFCGTALLAVQEKNTGRIYAGINSVLRELGFDESQIRYRRDKWMDDKVISKGVQKFLHPSEKGGMQETYCIDIKKLPLALAKLEITPKMEKDMQELSEKLEEYQDKCADVLAAAFLPTGEKGFEDIMIAQLQEQKIKENVDRVERKADLIDGDLQKFKRDMPILGIEESRITATVRKMGVKCLGGKESPAYKDRSLRSKVYSDIYGQLKREFGVGTYKAIKRSQCDIAVRIIEAYELPMALYEEITDTNAQVSLFKEGD